MRGIFITGTGTGVGKTVVTAGIVRWLRARGVDAVPAKPIQTGCSLSPAITAGGAAALIVPDLEFVLAAAGLSVGEAEKGLMCPYRYEPACSPHLAGRLVGRYPDLEVIEQCLRELAHEHHALVVEGAGGVLVPIDERRTMRDLMRRLGLPVIVVARVGLGTINHTLLTLEALRAAQLEVLGVVFNDVDGDASSDDVAIRRDNPQTIARLGNVLVLGELGRLPGLTGAASDPAIWTTFNNSLADLDRILAVVRGPS
jgi:dethiobiotin synthase